MEIYLPIAEQSMNVFLLLGLGGVAGLLAGSPGALPEKWTRPLKNRLATSVGMLDGIGFDTLGCHSQMLGCSFKKPRACSRSRSVWLDPRVRPT